MLLRQIRRLFSGLAVVCALQAVAAADEFCLDWSRPACGKVCKLVCEPKKLTATCYGCECKEICIPGPSRRGCKHCATCYGECDCDPCAACQNEAPKCEFCWRDWFACGCAKPRSVKTLFKYQAEKKICWYHWEVVDASCCDCVGKNGEAAVGGKSGIAQAAGAHSIYKPAPDDAQLGDVLPVSDDEWVKLAAVLSPDPSDTAAQVAGVSTPTPSSQPAVDATPLKEDSQTPSIAERFGRLFRK